MTSTAAGPATGRPPQLVTGVELMGRMEDSGFEETPCLVRRPDGQVVQLPALLYLVAERLNGSRDYEQVAAEVTQLAGAGLDPDDARFLVDEKLAPLGLIAGAEAAREAEPKPADDLLALKWKARVVPERASRAITSVFRPLFFGPIVLVIVAGFLALDGWLFFSHGISQPIRSILYQPALLPLLFAGVVVATAFHEIGHATACRYGGAKPGVMGVGLYVIWPVFYTDVTSAYGLDRRGRLRTDLGGVYFNAIFALACAGAYFATGWEPILVLVMVQTFAILQQLLPLGRLDGYLILTDLTGVPDLLGRMKPILRSALPGRKADEKVRDLKPWVRRVATSYVALLIPVLLFIFAMMLIHAPRVVATAYDSLGVRWDMARAAFSAGQIGLGLGNLLQCSALVLPALGMTVTTGRVGGRAGFAALAWSAGAPLRRAAVIAGMTATASAATFAWWPNGEYRPIQPGERGTVQAGIRSLGAVPSGRPALTDQRLEQLHGAPTERSREKALHDKTGKYDKPGQGNQTTTTETPSQTDTTTTPTNPNTNPSERPGVTTAPSGTGTDSGTGTGTDTGTDTNTSPSPAPTDTTTSPTPTGTTTTSTSTSTTPTDTATTTTTTP